MHTHSKSEFQSLSLKKRYQLLQEQGEFVASRMYGSHIVHLYSLSHFFVEVWVLYSINQVQWIEIQSSQTILNEYTDKIDIKKDLGL